MSVRILFMALLCLLGSAPATSSAQSPNAWPPVYVWASRRCKGPMRVREPTRAIHAAVWLSQNYPESERSAGAGPYTLRTRVGTVTMVADAGQPPECQNDWIRLDQGGGLSGNFYAGARCLMFPNAQSVTLTFSPAVQAVSVPLGVSDLGAEAFLATAYNGNETMGTQTVCGVSAVSRQTAPAPVLTVSAPPGQRLTSVVIRCSVRPQFGILLGLVRIIP